MSLLFFGLGGTVVTQTFTSSTTWVAPLSTNKIMKAVGQGASGTYPAYTLSYTYKVYDVDYRVGYGGSKTSPVITWSALQSYVTAALAILNDPASPYSSLDKVTIIQYSDGSYNRTEGVHVMPAGQQRQPGTAYAEVFNDGSSPISSDGTAYVLYRYLDNGAYGASASAFSMTYPGGTPSVPAAVVTTYTNIAVTPGASYPITVPSGGSITITYAK